MIIFGIVGLLLITVGLWIKKEKMQDVIYIVGGVALLAYSIHKEDPVFIILQIVFIISALLELVKLLRQK